METRLITLLTDFGHKVPFVGVMKGVICGINPNVRIIDLTHGIPPQDVMAGALALRHSVPFFPRGTIHVAVVDPGVGSHRRPLLIESDGCLFIGPDNGVLSLAFAEEAPTTTELSNETFHLKPTSTTFHGRDIFAPISAYLSLGIAPYHFGRKADDIQRLQWPQVIQAEDTIEGEVIYADGYGNLITNIQESDLMTLSTASVTVSLNGLTVNGLAPNYSSGAEGSYVALINSWGLLEISLFKGNAQLQSGVKIGGPVRIRRSQQQLT